MLKCKEMPKELRAKVVDYAIHLSNYCLTMSSVQRKTTQQLWSKKKLTISRLCGFGSIIYVHELDKERSKIINESEKYVFIGYNSISKG